jgi:hypothetical protein
MMTTTFQFLAQFGDGIAPTSTFLGGAALTTQASSYIALETFISQMIGLITILASIFFIFYFVIAALKWTTAGSDPGNVTKARDQMVQAVIGMLLVVASYSIIGLLGNLFGFEILDPARSLMGMTSSQAEIDGFNFCVDQGGTPESCNEQLNQKNDFATTPEQAKSAAKQNQIKQIQLNKLNSYILTCMGEHPNYKSICIPTVPPALGSSPNIENQTYDAWLFQLNNECIKAADSNEDLTACGKLLEG